VDDDDILTLDSVTGESVSLSRSFIEMSSPEIADIVDFIHGRRTWFPAFDVPVYDGEQGLIEVEPGYFEEQGWYGGEAETRLLQFAHLARPFAWMQDPRLGRLQELVQGATTPAGDARLKETSAQDLWDAMFIYARGSRFSEGLFAAYAEQLTAVANQLRRRLIDQTTI
jgi:hypothetical protein